MYIMFRILPNVLKIFSHKQASYTCNYQAKSVVGAELTVL